MQNMQEKALILRRSGIVFSRGRRDQADEKAGMIAGVAMQLKEYDRIKYPASSASIF
jgi:hypothetical protein